MNRSGTPGQNRPTLNSSASTSSADNNSNNNNNDSAYKAALKGASLAFQNTGSKGQSPAPPQGRSIDNRALIAATSTAHQYGLSPSRSPPRTKPPGISRQTTGSSARSAGTSGYDIEHGAIVQKLQQLSPQSAQRQGGHAATQLLMPPGKHTTTPDAKSPSFIAATLAASRSGSPSPRQPVQPHPYQQTVRRQQGGNTGTTHSAATSVTSLDLAADAVPLPSTNALISMFEKRDDDTDPVKKQTATPSSSNKPPVSKPKPKPKPRPVTPPGALNVVTKSSIKPPEILASPPARERPVSSPAPARGPAGEKHEPQREPTGLESKRPPPTPPPPRSTKNEVEESPSTRAALPKKKARASTPPRSVAVANADTVILSPQPRRASSQKILSRRSSEDDMTLASQPKGPPAVKPKPQHRASSAQYGKKSSSVPLKESPRPIVLAEKERRPTSSSSEDTFVSASSAPSPPPEPPRRRGIQPSTPDPPRAARPASTQSTPASARSQGRLLAPPPPLPQRQQQQQTTGIPLDSLANAIVAGSLASSRHTPTAASTSNSKKQPPSPPPTRKQTPLRMRQTLRQPPPANKSDDEDAAHNKHRHRKKPFGKSNKHSHHEGQRKRWREEITPRERKRYEGVWASNRGLLLLGGGGGGGGDKKTGTGVLPRQDPSSLSSSPANGRVPNQNLSPSQNRDQKRPSLGAASTSFSVTPPEERLGIAGDDTAMTTATATTTNTGDLVANVVVRDLWARSRLPPDELAEVWDLVDGRGRGALDRAEFVVGMWLVDQRLRGRKIPRKVSESVWASARGAGVRVRVKGAKKGR